MAESVPSMCVIYTCTSRLLCMHNDTRRRRHASVRQRAYTRVCLYNYVVFKNERKRKHLPLAAECSVVDGTQAHDSDEQRTMQEAVRHCHV
jgi:hypothetical protein